MRDDSAVGLGALASQLGLAVITTSAGRIVTANTVFCELTGYSETELQELPSVAVLFAPESRSLLPELYDQGSAGPTTATREMTIVDRNGVHIPTAVALALSPAPSATVDAVALVRDVRAERATAEQLDRMITVGDRIGTGVVVWDGHHVSDPLHLRLVFANRAAQQTLHLDLSEAADATMNELFPTVDVGDAARLLALCGTDRVEQFGDLAVGVGSDDHRLFRWQGLGLPNGTVAAVFEDTTSQRASESRQRDLLRRLVDIGDEERRRLALDLHDDAIQQIAAAAILVEGLQRHPDSPQLLERLASAGAALRTALAGLRSLVFKLSPPELLESGLEAAIRSAAEYLFADTGTAIVVDVDLGDAEDHLSSPTQTAAFRITAEALTNVHKHAQASHAIVSLSARQGDLHISVADDGVGVEAGTGAPGHIGLRSMQERAAAQGGTCSIEFAGPREGTTVTAVMPTAEPVEPRLPSPPVPASSEPDLTGLRLQLDSTTAAAREARQDAWQARHQLKTSMLMMENLLDPTASVESVTQTSARLLGQALRAGCAIHLISDDRRQLLRSASWHAAPEQLAALNAVAFSDRPADTTHGRYVLAGGGAVLTDISAASEEVQQHAPHLPYQPHSSIVAALTTEGTTHGTVVLVRDQTPETFTDEDVEFVDSAATQIGIAIQRAKDRTATYR